MKELSLGKISIHIYGEDIAVKDLFINDESFQYYLRSSFVWLCRCLLRLYLCKNQICQQQNYLG